MSANCPTLAVVLNELAGVEDKWQDIGVQLCLRDETLVEIEQNSNNPHHKLRETMRLWLSSGGTACWKDLIDALRTPCTNEKRLADTLHSKYCAGGVNDVMEFVSECDSEEDTSGKNVIKLEPTSSSFCSSRSCSTRRLVRQRPQLDTDELTDEELIPSVPKVPKPLEKEPVRKRPSYYSLSLDPPEMTACEFEKPPSLKVKEFTNKLPLNWRCTRCKNIPTKAFRSTCCRHVYCEACLNDPPDCPHCKKQSNFFNFRPDSILRRKINRRRAYCPNKGKGCTVEDRIHVWALKNHLHQNCNIECPYSSYGCTVYVNYTNYKRHLLQEHHVSI